MRSKQFEDWLQRIFHTQSKEISCSECFDLVSVYIDIEMSGVDPTGKFSQVKQHLNQCSVCREEYETLRDLRRLEEDNRSPSLNELRRLIH